MTVSLESKGKVKDESTPKTPSTGQVTGSAEKHRLKVKAKAAKGDKKTVKAKLNNGLLQLNKNRKQDFKKMKKQRKRRG